MKTFAFTTLLTTSVIASNLHNMESQVDLLLQFGGKDFKGDTQCASGSYCKVFNEWYSQCQLGGDNAVGVWGQCGGDGYTGPTKCAEGCTSKKWSDNYSQCVPSSDNPTKISSNFVMSNGVCFDRTDNGTDYAVPGINSFEDCVNEVSTRGKTYATWNGKMCDMFKLVYSYKMNESCKSAAKFNPDKWDCQGNMDY
ncbi:hypothetical protein THRCLA_22998 [Thraustotheca clavata]|uniref:CBM1 domain-containing protein n=1 Tax=Thraustotheca clavata TaxID=74557 RepID=A0A1V9YJK4_9STRA|nr:hypothetical protein THRCLA_22998 [Thraustotheca clavata]